MKRSIYIFLTQFLQFIESSEMYYRTSVPVYSNISTPNWHVDQISTPGLNLVYTQSSSGQYYVYNIQPLPSYQRYFQPFPSISGFGYVPMPYYPVPAYISSNQPCIQSYLSYMNAQPPNFAPNMPMSSNFSTFNDPEQLLTQDRTNATLLASSNLQMASESINNSTQPPNIYAGGIPEQNHMENPSVPTLTYIVLNKDN
ncbi:hypothetical protein CWI38_2093p0010, partial [Hamiltosporidium tvaerminnensis]